MIRSPLLLGSYQELLTRESEQGREKVRKEERRIFLGKDIWNCLEKTQTIIVAYTPLVQYTKLDNIRNCNYGNRENTALDTTR